MQCELLVKCKVLKHCAQLEGSAPQFEKHCCREPISEKWIPVLLNEKRVTNWSLFISQAPSFRETHHVCCKTKDPLCTQFLLANILQADIAANELLLPFFRRPSEEKFYNYRQQSCQFEMCFLKFNHHHSRRGGQQVRRRRIETVRHLQEDVNSMQERE